MKEKAIRVLKVEPHKMPEVVVLENTLQALQEAVSIGADYVGLIEILSLDEKTCILCNEEGKLNGLEANRRLGSDRNEWSGTVVFTGENSMFMQTNRNRGLYARLLEFSFRWTAGAEQAEDLNRFTAKHYGSAAEPLIETILAMSDQEVEELFREVQTGVFEALQPQNGVERRVMDLYSVIVMSAVIAQEAWKMPFDLPAIMGLLKDHHKRNEAVKDRAEIVYESIKQQIMENWDRFPEDATKSYLSSVWGERGKYKQDNCVWITADRFEKFLKCAGEENVKTALEPLHTKGWLVKYGDRYKKPHRMGTMEIKCYCILLENTGPSRQSTRPKPVHSNRQALLEE